MIWTAIDGERRVDTEIEPARKAMTATKALALSLALADGFRPAEADLPQTYMTDASAVERYLKSYGFAVLPAIPEPRKP